MPRRNDLKRILVLGSGPIVIGQACEFDYSGTQAIKALKAEGYEVVLVNSNPATIMTDPELADRTYVEPLTPAFVEAVIAREKPDALLPTVGGQTALNLALQLAESGVLKAHAVEVLGASPEAIRIAEDRSLFRQAMVEIGLEVPVSAIATDLDQAQAFAARAGYPLVVRPSFTLGGSGGGIARNADELAQIVLRGLALSPTHQVLVEEALLGWKEFELEVMRDWRDNVVVVCSIENVDPMGVHTGDSITVAPAQTLTDLEYQRLRNAAAAILRKVGVATGGSNVQFAVDPRTGRMRVIEMNPRVSRSSALASKATGFPIAKIAAKLAVGYSLDEIPNDITRKTPAAFEPALDYVVTKIPTFAFEKFPGAESTLGTQMKSVGEVMAIGRTLSESFFKALRSLEALRPWRPVDLSREELVRLLSVPHENRIRAVIHALERGLPVDEVSRLTGIDAWFIEQFERFAQTQRGLRGRSLAEVDDAALLAAKKLGFSDRRLADLTGAGEDQVRGRRRKAGLTPVFKRVDTCAGEFEASTPYLYSCYESEDESAPEARRKVMILGSGANRIGQGIEFDYCCCHAAFALREAGVQSLMVNCNPETVSTDYDTADRLYFEPLTLEDVLEVYERERPDGVIVQFGGQTPLNLTAPLHAAGVPILGTSPDSIDLAEDRERFNALLDRLGIRRPPNAFARTVDEAAAAARRLGFPVLVRPSYVLGGRAMAIVYEERELERFVRAALQAAPDNAVLVDRFLEDAMELDVDALCDGQECVIAGILQHVEQAGVHSGDSMAVLPPERVPARHLERIREITRALARELKVVGLMNAQLAIAGGEVYVLEVNPRASRTVPFLAKATGVPLAKMATRLMLGESLRSLGLTRDLEVRRHFVKAPVFPFVKFPGVDPRLSPEMTSTGEVMGIASSEGLAYHKAMLAAGTRLPDRGTALITVNDRDKAAVVPVARRLAQLGFALAATRGTAAVLQSAGLDVEVLHKLHEGSPNLLDAMRTGRIHLIVNTPLGKGAQKDGWALRTSAVQLNLPCLTTLPGAAAAAEAIAAVRAGALEITSLQELAHAPGSA
ncbi:MAG TPA: carbamoyl-phosphate synthase large subunit [Myxococcales bacterium]|jgi:carbamoyl-phosphate synthase large subunit